MILQNAEIASEELHEEVKDARDTLEQGNVQLTAT
jgi:hypothetical protein